MSHKPHCRSCGVTIQFGLTDKGRRMPLDVAASDDGNVYFHDDGVHIHVLKRGEGVPEGRPRFHSHFETCPQGDSFRKKMRAAKPPKEALAAAMAEERADLRSQFERGALGPNPQGTLL